MVPIIKITTKLCITKKKKTKKKNDEPKLGHLVVLSYHNDLKKKILYKFTSCVHFFLFVGHNKLGGGPSQIGPLKSQNVLNLLGHYSTMKATLCCAKL